MKFTIKVKPNANKTEILEQKNDFMIIAIAQPPDKNKANIELIKFLKKHFKKQVKIISGLKSREKVVEIN